jgi:hypothetical protein
MLRYIAELNVQHFSERIATERDPVKLKMLRLLLTEEEAKLAALSIAEDADAKPLLPIVSSASAEH